MYFKVQLYCESLTVKAHAFYFCRCICELLRDKLVVLVTHQLQFTLQASRILALKEVCLVNYRTINIH